MRLKSLEITGFKSFADKTLFEFHSGVTGIVGPNGCGKSNVVDAVKWALGETSAKALRGGEMADVIFNGTDKRKPLGMAEVVLTFSDCEAALKVDYNEVSITRRVFRDGRGEYELNGTPCRMKDIARLFMDTGVGRNMYSIMEQGKIDMLLSAKPEDRRQVFEEAAGITKSKAEKKEALRKLEYAEANLLRVTDILSEMKRQIGSAQRQASKARRYQEIHRDLVVLDTHLHFKRYQDLAAERSELETSTHSLRLRQADLEHEMEKEERSLAETRAEVGEMEAQIGSLRSQLNQIQGQINAATHKIGFNVERKVDFTGRIQAHEEEISGCMEKVSLLEEQSTSIRSALESASQTLMERREAVELASREAIAQRESRGTLERRLQESRQALHAAEGAIISAQAEITSHSAQAQADLKRQEQLQRDLSLLEEERSAKQDEEQEIKSRMAEMEAEIEFLQLELHTREREAQEVESELEIIQRTLREQHRTHSEKQSKRDLLRQLISAGEGLESGTRSVLGGLDDPDKFLSAARGLLSTYLEVESGFIPAVEAALGGNLQAVVVSGAATAQQMMLALKEGRMGTAAVLPEDWQRRDNGQQMQALPDGALAWALDKVKVKDQVRPTVLAWLANVVIVSDLAQAVALKRQWTDLAFATLEGEFISTEGVIRGGAAREQAASLLHQQGELKELEAHTAELEKTLATHESRRDELADRQRSLRTCVEEQREILQTRRVGQSTQQGQLTLVQRELVQITSKTEGIEWELGDLQKRHGAVSGYLTDAKSRKQNAEEEASSRHSQAAELIQEVEAVRQSEAQAAEQLNDARTQLAVEQRHLQALEEQASPIQSRLSELQSLVSRRRTEVENLHERIAAADDESQALTRGMEEAKVQVEELSVVLESRSAERSELAQQLAAREGELGHLRRQITKLGEQRGNEEVRTTQIGLRMENLENSAQERYRVHLESFEQDVHALLASISAQKAAKGRSEKRRAAMESAGDTATQAESAESAAEQHASSRIESLEEAVAAMEAENGGPDWEFVESAVLELKQRIDSMGPVNLDAIQEFEELEERHNFLQKEYDDLQHSKSELLEIIQRINNEAKKRFVDTFGKVRENFRTTFKELFGQGAQADLVLVNEDDPLESGIEVIAKPPGKRPTSITLLSGGERSMTAVALLFSIYMVKPSPFCILDELDAPLDESNIGRFLRMLDKFIERSQFVIVTHNKRTMRRADVLYGVTMEEFGVSKPVGMRMSDSERIEMREREAEEIARQDAAAEAAERRLAEEEASAATI